MSTNVPQSNDNQEIDLAQISKRIGGFFESVKTFVFNGIQFFVRNWIIVLILIVAGFAVGLYFDTKKAYSNEIIVTPNFGSVDYLYSKIDLLESKIISGDTVFLKEIVGIKEPKNLNEIKIKPITDVYNFVKNKPENFELLKLLAEDGDVNKVIEESTTSKNYPFQKIIIYTKKKASEEKLIAPLFAYLNNSDYFKKIQKQVYTNTISKIRQNDSIINQIDGVLSNFSSATKYSNRSDKLLYNNENSQLNDIIKTKDVLLSEQGTHRIELIGFDKIIKESSVTMNIEAPKFVNGNLKLLLPLVFVLLFVFLNAFNSFYKGQQRKKVSGTLN
ncbi:hypothetical protein D0817_09160 [Flavobacterium cupreum]|uniref:Uncharacterized protein n=1 Tax=Flavobacterium cupreum TaxID=2133766 RepID=A0A434A8J4_9FLAO|nr:hypothetical protein [Flavobacterium cupreum]RUT70634.1 hypothetical protein D0817_09160 [Flavobacterium cupreum]